MNETDKIMEEAEERKKHGEITCPFCSCQCVPTEAGKCPHCAMFIYNGGRGDL